MPGVPLVPGVHAPVAPLTKARAEAGVAPKQGWTRQEDETILRTVQTTGMKWSAIAAVLPGRTDDAVRNRYLRLQRKKGGLAIGAHVDGGMTVQITDQAKRGDMWTSEEDTQIMAAVATHGLKWQEIAHGLPGRSANAVRNRYLRLHTPTGTVGASGGGYNSPSASMGAQFLQELAAAAHARQETQETSDAALCAQRDAAAHAAAMQAAAEAQTAQYAAEFAATQRYAAAGGYTDGTAAALAAGSYGDAAAHHYDYDASYDPAAAYDDGGNGNGIGPDAVAFAAPGVIPGAESLAGNAYGSNGGSPSLGGMVYDDANADTAPGTVPGGPSAFAPAGGGDGGGDVTENRVRSPRAQEAAHTLLAGAFPGAAGWRGSPLRPPARS